MEPVPAPVVARARRELATVTGVALLLAGLVAWSWFVLPADTGDGPPASGLISRLYEPPDSQVEALFNARDGQIFATLATDPLAGRSDLIRGGAQEEAYRYQRPGYGWIGWLASGGQPAAVPWALVVVTVLSVAGLVAALGAALQRARVSAAWALVVLITPGVVANLMFIGPESLGTALVVLAVLRARRSPGIPWDAVALFAAAGLCRESLLLVPAVLALRALLRRDLPRVGALALAAAPYVAWVLFLRVRIGAWPRGKLPGRLSPVPFEGLVRGTEAWTLAEGAPIVFVLALGLAGLVLATDGELRALVGANLALAAFMGHLVWERAEGTGRTLLPLAAFSLWAVAAARARRPANEHEFAIGLDGADRLAPCPTPSSSGAPASTTSAGSTSTSLVTG